LNTNTYQAIHFPNLYNKTLQWDDVPSGAGLLTIQPNINIAAGDRLALFITGMTDPTGGPSAAGDYCYLNKAAASAFLATSSTTTLFTNLIGDVSPKGLEGKESPVKVTGRELSWYSVIE
jgi:hypothetical protein